MSRDMSLTCSVSPNWQSHSELVGCLADLARGYQTSQSKGPERAGTVIGPWGSVDAHHKGTLRPGVPSSNVLVS